MPRSPRPSSKAISTVVEDRQRPDAAGHPGVPDAVDGDHHGAGAAWRRAISSGSSAACLLLILLALGLIQVDRVVTAQGTVVSRSADTGAAAAGGLDRALDRRARGAERAGGPGAGAARSHLRRRRCRRAGGAGVEPAGAGVAAAGGGRRPAVRLFRDRPEPGAAGGDLRPAPGRVQLQAGELHAEDQRTGVRDRQGQFRCRRASAAGLQVATNVEQMRRDLERLQVGSKLNTLAAMDNRAEMERNLHSSEQIAVSCAARPRRDGRRARRLRAVLACRHLGEAG